ncbi:MAG: class I SAM-dependent methyltransferase [Armatimonadota bacterium]
MNASLEAISVRIGARVWHLEAVKDQDALLAGVNDDAGLADFPYGALLWPAAVGLAAHIDAMGTALSGMRVCEIGCGIGLAGLVAAAHGARVVQTDWQSPVLTLAERAALRNGVGGIERRLADWRDWPDDLSNFDLVIGSDVLYERSVHDALGDLLPRLPADRGSILLSDPLRPPCFDLLDRWEREHRFEVEMGSRHVDWEGASKEILIAHLRLPRA